MPDSVGCSILSPAFKDSHAALNSANTSELICTPIVISDDDSSSLSPVSPRSPILSANDNGPLGSPVVRFGLVDYDSDQSPLPSISLSPKEAVQNLQSFDDMIE